MKNKRNTNNKIQTDHLWFEIETVKQKNIHESYDALIEDLNENIEHIRRYYITLTGKPQMQLSAIDIAELIMVTCDVIKIRLDKRDQSLTSYLIYNPITKKYDNKTDFLKKICNSIFTKSRNKISFNALIRDVNDLIDTSNYPRFANLPPNYIVKFNNCIYDLKNKCLHNGLDANGKEYDFINIVEYDLKTIDNVNQTYLGYVKKVFNLWSGNKEDNELLLRQICLASIEGNGRGRYIILKSDGGDGKSTFQYILETLAGVNNTQRTNLHDFDDDNEMNKISKSTKLILGDDLQNRHKVSNKAMTRLKSLVTNEKISVSEKFMPNKMVYTNAVMIQNTNTDPNFYENTPALKDRLLIYNWKNYNFRDNPITEFNLDELLGKNEEIESDQTKQFNEAILAYVIWNTNYFNKFSMTEEIKQDTNNMLSSNDTINLFIKELKENDILNNAILPSKIIYDHYKQWLLENNPGSKPMKSMEFGQRFSKEIKKYNFKPDKPMRLNKITDDQFNFSLLNINKNNLKNEKSGIYINENNILNEKHLNEIIEIFNNKTNINQIKNYSINEIYKAFQINFSELRGLIEYDQNIMSKINNNDIDTFIQSFNEYYNK